MYSSPLGKDWRSKKVAVEKPLEKFKATKAIVSPKTAKELVGHTVLPHELLWIDGWLDNLVRSRSLPPQCRGKDAFSAITQFLSPPMVLSVLETLRSDFEASHPKEAQTQSEDYGFLLAELEAYPAHQSPPPPCDRNSSTRIASPSHSEELDML